MASEDPPTNDKHQEEILLAKRMFFGGCLGLPWLWICNALYFRLAVFGPCVLIDYWPGKSPPPPASTSAVSDGEDNNNANEDEDQQRQRLDRKLELEIQKKELIKWVKRSTRGAVVAVVLFVTWIITFQVNKEHFGSKWFVMDETDAAKTGW
mmetsp:Transcript_14414/g.24645  ORF Transcript_14414/g.24645 Transcript_14414/m.24645 type:complete len:152 (+) Transcript_14414:204-659(+)|eukprot:CAMPEP_0184468308 /NCGR_PEP_ID=MMETSP0740-20130409/78192_1 /TAXON_ID=385413 /ORGANISM="Thalassiosira miniscula, Strain CCMP1093" /LENGTH=151 /DNA_ID=CAMNT_0026843859 /DNA_START=192 /DNA_END=647 /DNA_ORIENTATION=-